MSFGLEVMIVFAVGACLLGVAAMSMKARHKTLTKRNSLRERRKFQEQNSSVSQRWN